MSNTRVYIVAYSKIYRPGLRYSVRRDTKLSPILRKPWMDEVVSRRMTYDKASALSESLNSGEAFLHRSEVGT